MGCAGVALVFLCLFTLGSRSQPTFIQRHKDLLLTVTEEVQKETNIFYWKLNGIINIITLIKGQNNPEINHYTNRVEFFQQNHSLILKNVQLSDSGIYTAVASGNTDQILSTHDVRVQAPVSPVSVRVVSGSNSSESCNFTVRCRTELSSSISRSFTWDRHTCEEVHPPTPGPAPFDLTPPVLTSSVLPSSLQLSLTNERIVCNHSNQVSSIQAMKSCQQICQIPAPAHFSKTLIWGIVLGILCGLGAIVVGAFLYRRRQKNKTANTMNASYEVPQVPPAPQPVQSDAKAVADPPNLAYSLVGPHTGPASPPRPDDVYAQVNKPSRSINKT